MSFPLLSAGDTVAVVAPAGPADDAALAAVPALYARFGLQARLYPGCHQRTGYLAGSDDVRLADLHAALADDGVAAVHCLRGGYGCMRLLDRIDAALVRRARKLLVGYSDVTALHALWAAQGVPSLHAPMPASDLLRPDRAADRDALFALLMQGGLRSGDVLRCEPLTETVPLHVAGKAEGLLIGGNLSLVAALLGTPWAWPVARPEGAILFIEDINEERYRIDRLLTQLRLAGVLDAAAGFVLGSFTESASPLPLLAEMLLPLGKPLLGGWPAGHGTPNRPLPLGARVRLDAGARTITLLQDVVCRQ